MNRTPITQEIDLRIVKVDYCNKKLLHNKGIR
jgi:hypothetical protein